MDNLHLSKDEIQSIIAIARTGDPVAPASLSGVIINVNHPSFLNFSRLERFSTTKTSLDNKILWDVKLESIPASILGQSVATAFTLLSTRNCDASGARPGFAITQSSIFLSSVLR